MGGGGISRYWFVHIAGNTTDIQDSKIRSKQQVPAGHRRAFGNLFVSVSRRAFVWAFTRHLQGCGTGFFRGGAGEGGGEAQVPHGPGRAALHSSRGGLEPGHQWRPCQPPFTTPPKKRTPQLGQTAPHLLRPARKLRSLSQPRNLAPRSSVPPCRFRCSSSSSSSQGAVAVPQSSLEVQRSHYRLLHFRATLGVASKYPRRLPQYLLSASPLVVGTWFPLWACADMRPESERWPSGTR